MTGVCVSCAAGNPPFLARMYAGFQTDANLFFVMELITGGDLMFHVLKEGNMPERATNFYAAEVCCGLWFLCVDDVIGCVAACVLMCTLCICGQE